jgi:hypothetical protein
MTETNHELKLGAFNVLCEKRRVLALSLAPLALVVACGRAASPSAAVHTTGAHASTEDDSGYGYEFEADSSKNAAASPASDLSLPHAQGDRVPPETVQAVIRSSYGALASCYAAGLKKDPSLAGAVTVKLVAGTDGVTKEAVEQKSTLADKDVVACVVGEIGKLTYPAGGGVLTVVYPIQFAP